MTSPDWLFALADTTAALPDETVAMRFHYALRHGTMKMGLYAPRGSDTQGPHRQDELYFVVAGQGDFIKGDECRTFGPGDAIFVEAGVAHRFDRFTDDFVAWVVFWGADDGEG